MIGNIMQSPNTGVGRKLYKSETLDFYRHPMGITMTNCKALYEDGRLVLVEEDHELFNRIIEGLMRCTTKKM